MKKYSLLIVALFLFYSIPTFAGEPTIKNFHARWVAENYAIFQVGAIINVPPEGLSEDFTFTWEARVTNPGTTFPQFAITSSATDGIYSSGMWACYIKIYNTYNRVPLHFVGYIKQNGIVIDRKEFTLFPGKHIPDIKIPNIIIKHVWN